MPRIRLIMLSLFAMFAMSAVASASASAAECPDTVKGGDVALCKGGVEQEGTFTVTSKKKAGTASKLEVTAGPTIVCEEATNAGKLVAADSSLTFTFTIKFSKKCEVTNTTETKTNCEVKEPIETKEVNGTFVGENPEKVLFKPAAGETFAEVTIKNKEGKACTFKIENAKVTGTQEAKIPDAKKEQIKHELKAEPAESKLKFAGKEAKFELTEEFEFTPAVAFSFQES
jgi:hypothetical protein